MYLHVSCRSDHLQGVLFERFKMYCNVLLRLSLGVEFLNPFAVCVILEGFHCHEGMKQEPWEEASPHAAKAIERSQGGTNSWREVIVVASQVHDES